MKIVLLGGGTGGHFYPLVAVAQALRALVQERKLLEPQLFCVTTPDFVDAAALAEHDITFVESSAGKLRRYSSAKNITDAFKTAFGILRAFFQLFRLFPDVIFSTGGFVSFPTLVAARVLGIPVVIYDADATPGRVSVWASSFARWIGVAHPDAAAQFPEAVRHKIARTGHPIRFEVERLTKDGGYEFLKLDSARKTLLVLGGSLGAHAINNVIIDALPELLKTYNVIHQTGKDHLDEVLGMARISAPLEAEGHYRAFGLLNALALRMAAGISTLVISRAGSGTLFEIAAWGLPSIIVPIPESVSHDQTKNAFSYARSGAAVVIEQENLSKHILLSEIDRITASENTILSMAERARTFAQPDAAKKIARVVLETALEHTA